MEIIYKLIKKKEELLMKRKNNLHADRNNVPLSFPTMALNDIMNGK